MLIIKIRLFEICIIGKVVWFRSFPPERDSLIKSVNGLDFSKVSLSSLDYPSGFQRTTLFFNK